MISTNASLLTNWSNNDSNMVYRIWRLNLPTKTTSKNDSFIIYGQFLIIFCQLLIESFELTDSLTLLFYTLFVTLWISPSRLFPSRIHLICGLTAILLLLLASFLAYLRMPVLLWLLIFLFFPFMSLVLIVWYLSLFYKFIWNLTFGGFLVWLSN